MMQTHQPMKTSLRTRAVSAGLIAVLGATLLVSVPAAAHDRDHHGATGLSVEHVTCQSARERYAHCAPASGKIVTSARLVRQLSRTGCHRGHNWGFDARGVWVNRGCRASFDLTTGVSPAVRAATRAALATTPPPIRRAGPAPDVRVVVVDRDIDRRRARADRPLAYAAWREAQLLDTCALATREQARANGVRHARLLPGAHVRRGRVADWRVEGVARVRDGHGPEHVPVVCRIRDGNVRVAFR